MPPKITPHSFSTLSRFHLLDFSRFFPGPYCTRLLADMGLRITRLELPFWTDPVKTMLPQIGGVSALHRFLSRGKKNLSFDFRGGSGRKKLESLLRKTDVLVEGFRPGLMKRLGLDYARLKKTHPRLIYCSITGYDPKSSHARLAGHDLNFQAMSGILSQSASPPHSILPPVLIADLTGSFHAACSILAALMEREKTGKGRHLQVTMLRTCRWAAALPIAEYLETGKLLRSPARWWNAPYPFYALYPTQDKRLIAVAALEKTYARELLKELGLSRWIVKMDRLPQYRTQIQNQIKKTFLKRPLSYWKKKLLFKELCATPVLTIPESFRFHP
ncbi:MAG: CoA transferase [Elusimicrobia bacterium]|nr:CoA transferase [Elusimicrobiota bacterium]